MIPLTSRLFIPLQTVFASGVSPVHPYVDLRVTQEAVLKCVKKMSPKTCALDPIPTSLLFECSDQVVPLLITIVNQSLATGIFPSCIKSAIVKPLLEKKKKLT